MASRTALIAATAALAATPGALAGRPDFHQKMAGPDGAFYGKGFGFEAAPGDMFVNNAARLAEPSIKRPAGLGEVCVCVCVRARAHAGSFL